MSQEDTKASQESLHFFISYTSSDRQWAEWIAMQLEQKGYTLVIQAWDFRPGSNFVAEMDRAAKRAERTLLVLSPAYLLSDFAFSEWAAAFSQDPRGTNGRVLPVRVEPCDVSGLLRQVLYIDLVSLDETQARERLLEGVKKGRVKPTTVGFPGQNVPHAHASFPGSLPTIWNIPYVRNPVFTGREQLLAHLAEKLHPGEAVALAQPQVQAISGLGGIGKTQLAVEYAYRHRRDYQAVFWTRADTADALIEGYGEIARLLQLPEKEEQDQSRVVKAVQEWLRTQTGWLLILDNADDLTLARTYLPPTFCGHILLTTRAQSMGRLAARIEVNTLDLDVGALLLLRRAGVIAADALLETASPSDLALARTITEEVGGLPLALDQAGAYIEETECGLYEYRCLYQTRAAALLRNRGGVVEDHPEPVATTWSLSFVQVEQHHPAAADLLRLCAFLAPDAIPVELLTEGAKELGAVLAPVAADPYLFGEAITALRTYSLLARDPQAQMLTIHRLVQAVLRDSMPAKIQQHWMHCAVLAVNAAFPDVTFESWSACERLLPHALVCAAWIKQAQIMVGEAAHLLNQVGEYLIERGRFASAESLFQRALAIREQQLGAEHLDTATSLNSLAVFYQFQGKYEQAKPLLVRALAIREQQLGAEHPDTANSLNNLAGNYQFQGEYEQVEPLLVRALAIREQQLGAEHLDTASSLNRLAAFYLSQGKYEQAEPLAARALAIREHALGTEHPDTASSLNSLAFLYNNQGKYEQTEPLLVRALAIIEHTLGPEHPDTGNILHALASLYLNQSKYEQAEPLFQRALYIREHALGPEHPYTAATLHALARLYQEQGKHEQAEPLFQRALHIHEHVLGPEHPSTLNTLDSLAYLYQEQGKYEQAEPLFQRALAIYEQRLGAEHLDTASSLHNLAGFYRSQGKYEQAKPLLVRALAIRELQLGAEHLDTANSLNDLALVYTNQGKYKQAEPLAARALAIYEQQLEAEHPYVATSLNNLANIYRYLDKYEEAEPLYLHALQIEEQQMGGSNHLGVTYPLYGLAELYRKQEKYAEAEPLYLREIQIREQQAGPEHSDMAYPLTGLGDLAREQGKYAEAEALYQRALSIRKEQLGSEHLLIAFPLHGLAELFQAQGKYAEAEPFYQRALRIREQALGPDHPSTGDTRRNYATLLRAMGRDDEAKHLEKEP